MGVFEINMGVLKIPRGGIKPTMVLGEFCAPKYLRARYYAYSEFRRP